MTDEIALVQTIDFFTPIVDDPFTFGQIAAANALSDLYAMGARPLSALNLVCFPSKKMEIDVLRRVLLGGLNKVHEAGAVLLGGHSIDDPEIKYGLAVTGLAHPDKIVRNNTAKVGDKLILTKPIGTGVISTAVKGGLVDERGAAKVAQTMAMLNKGAAEAMIKVGVNACTDVTGFGLVGHLTEMMSEDRFGVRLDLDSLPLMDGAVDFMRQKIAPGGLFRNRKFWGDRIIPDDEVPQEIFNLLFDPQTSGGLLIAVECAKCDLLRRELALANVATIAEIGEIIPEPIGRLIVR